MSSAKILTILSVTLSGRSFIIIKKSKGPRTVPWGIPDVTLASEDLAPFAKITCFLSLPYMSVEHGQWFGVACTTYTGHNLTSSNA